MSCPRPQLVHCDIYIIYNAYCSRHEYQLGTDFFIVCFYSTPQASPLPSTGLVGTGRVFSITSFDPFTTGAGLARLVGLFQQFFFLSLSHFYLVFSHIFYPCYGMARKVLKVTTLAGSDLLSVWGLGFLSYGKECQDFVTLGNCMALYVSSKLGEQPKATSFSHILSPQYNERHINE